MVDVADFLPADHEFRALADGGARRDRAIRRTYGDFKPVLPRVPEFQLITGRLPLDYFPDDGAFLGGPQLAGSVNALVEIISGAKADGAARRKTNRGIQALFDQSGA